MINMCIWTSSRPPRKAQKKTENIDKHKKTWTSIKTVGLFKMYEFLYTQHLGAHTQNKLQAQIRIQAQIETQT